MGLRTLLIDNLDSYTYNLFQLIAEVNEGSCERRSRRLNAVRRRHADTAGRTAQRCRW
jgi:anthranilate/para-aminobenzoate synthase component II